MLAPALLLLLLFLLLLLSGTLHFIKIKLYTSSSNNLTISLH